jgi:hypothetical protein
VRVDLDLIEADAQYALNKAAGPAREGRLSAIAQYNVPALVAELRAARVVVKAVRRWHDPIPDSDPCDTCRALDAYDQAVGS